MATAKKLPAFSDIEDRIDMILEGASGELDDATKQELEDELDALGIKEAEKIDAFAQFLKIRKAKIEAVRKEGQALLARARSLENSMDYLKAQYLLRMDMSGLQKIRGASYSISIQERDKAVVTDMIDDIPDEYKVVKTEVVPDKEKILAHLQEGVVIPGCSLGKSRYIVAR